jgi:lipoyl(octanoyl) transferase
VVDVSNKIKIKKLGLSDYAETWQAMKEFTKERTPEMIDELWILEHSPVFTLGTNGKPEHILDARDTPIVKIDRGGQVTYHGPGQLVIYLLLNLHRRKLGVRKLVSIIEDSIIKLLANYNVKACSNPKAPGVYVEEKKIAALGLRVSRGFTTHGLSLNVDMDLSPFTRINPCGYENLEVIQCKSLGINSSLPKLADELVILLKEQLSLPVKS